MPILNLLIKWELQESHHMDNAPIFYFGIKTVKNETSKMFYLVDEESASWFTSLLTEDEQSEEPERDNSPPGVGELGRRDQGDVGVHQGTRAVEKANVWKMRESYFFYFRKVFIARP